MGFSNGWQGSSSHSISNTVEKLYKVATFGRTKLVWEAD